MFKNQLFTVTLLLASLILSAEDAPLILPNVPLIITAQSDYAAACKTLFTETQIGIDKLGSKLKGYLESGLERYSKRGDLTQVTRIDAYLHIIKLRTNTVSLFGSLEETNSDSAGNTSMPDVELPTSHQKYLNSYFEDVQKEFEAAQKFENKLKQKLVSTINDTIKSSVRENNLQQAEALQVYLKYLHEHQSEIPLFDVFGQAIGNKLEENSILAFRALFIKDHPSLKEAKLEGTFTWESDTTFSNNFLHLEQGVIWWPHHKAFELSNGYLSTWVKYHGSNGSVAGMATDAADEYSIIIWNQQIGSYSGWPAQGNPTMSSKSVPQNEWIQIGLCWQGKDFSFYYNGEKLSQHQLINPISALTGRLEFGLNSPGGDEYLNMSIISASLYKVAPDEKQIKLLYQNELNLIRRSNK